MTKSEKNSGEELPTEEFRYFSVGEPSLPELVGINQQRDYLARLNPKRFGSMASESVYSMSDDQVGEVYAMVYNYYQTSVEESPSGNTQGGLMRGGALPLGDSLQKGGSRGVGGLYPSRGKMKKSSPGLYPARYGVGVSKEWHDGQEGGGRRSVRVWEMESLSLSDVGATLKQLSRSIESYNLYLFSFPEEVSSVIGGVLGKKEYPIKLRDVGHTCLLLNYLHSQDKRFRLGSVKGLPAVLDEELTRIGDGAVDIFQVCKKEDKEKVEAVLEERLFVFR